jgi:HAD superfamily hydrolase (TIGR01509 family)
MIGFDGFFDTIVSADDVANHKPFPDTFLRCAEIMGVEPQFCQVFEDGEMGLLAAERAGMIVTDIRPYL